jgi:hypothetical protein
MKTNGFVMALGAFFLTLMGIAFVYFSGGPSEHTLKLNHPMKMEFDQGLAYSMDNMEGPIEKDFTFRCDLKTGEGYFSLKSKNLAWGSTHCQDMVGAVTEIEEGKKTFALIMVKEIDKRIYYRVERNLSL